VGNSISDPFTPEEIAAAPSTYSWENLRVWILFSRSSYSTPRQPSNLGFAISSLTAGANSKSPGSGGEH